ncbi:MAG: uracil-DNA glycosylase, partial [Christensenella sp.]
YNVLTYIRPNKGNILMKAQQLRELYARIQKNYPDERLVFGDGNIDARLLLIGEAPGKEEIAKGRPFVGKAGKNLDEFLTSLALTRENFYLTNVCKFRPTKTSAKNSISNRPPTKAEILAAQPFLREETAIIAPKIIVTLGNTPLRAVTDFSADIGKCHGRAVCAANVGGAVLFALYHPASIIYNPSLKETYIQDISKLALLLQQIL